MPRRIQGRDNIRALLHAGGQHMRQTARFSAFESVVVHQTLDPEVIVTEFEVLGQLGSDGQSYRFSNLQVLRVGNGQILSLRDYWSPLDRPELAGLSVG